LAERRSYNDIGATEGTWRGELQILLQKFCLDDIYSGEEIDLFCHSTLYSSPSYERATPCGPKKATDPVTVLCYMSGTYKQKLFVLGKMAL
jgi:hypothetical protein